MASSFPAEIMDIINGRTQSDRERRPPGTKPWFVKLHPNDKGDGLDDVFYGDPKTFIPPKNDFGEVLAWGVFRYDAGGYADWDMGRNLARTMRYQFDYLNTKGALEIPQRQFIDALIKKKEGQLAAMDLGDLKEHDYILRITMVDIPLHARPSKDLSDPASFTRGYFGEELIYRRFKVSGGINLDTFQDKVVQPVMGWARNAHAFVFQDLKDGACFGPKDSRAIDMCHVDKVCYAYIDADKYTLAHLLKKEGERTHYFYDFGDRWTHYIEVEKILPISESDGSVVVLEGRGMCPPEDGHGNRQWAEEIWKFSHGTVRQKNELMETTKDATNYKDQPFVRSEFNPYSFSVPKAQKAVVAALNSSASVRTGPKMFNTPMSMDGIRETLTGKTPNVFTAEPKRGQHVVREFQDGRGFGFMSETVSERRDRMKQALCAKCGSPHKLKACAGCKKIWYCGQEHQRQDWKTHKPECKSAKAT